MTRAEMLAELKKVIGETDNDPAWGDTRLLDMLAEGQDKFCADTGYFVDKSTASICQFDSVADTDTYALSDRIISVLEVWQGTTKLGKFNQVDKDPDGGVATATEFPTNSQEPYAWQTDEETGRIRLYPTPIEAKTYTLRVWRYPVEWLADTQAEPEIPVQFHRACVEWASFLALNDHDFEIQDDVKARDHLALYEYYVGKGISAFNRMRGGSVTAGPSASSTYTVC